MTNIILCGGNGTRLWPLSRTLMPKQFVKLFEEESLFQKTVIRNEKVCDSQFIVSNAEQYFLAVDQLEELTHNSTSNTRHSTQYLLEPVGRNTAPAIALACLALDPEETLLVTPSDHLIKDEKAYLEAVEKAKYLAEKDNLVTFGITPQYPETGFGYIEAIASVIVESDSDSGMDVIHFHEKPDQQTAQQYINKNQEDQSLSQSTITKFFWNSGMFCFKAGIFLEELEKYAPEIYTASLKAFQNAKQEAVIRIHHEEMMNIPSESIDYAVMEKSDRVKVVPADIDWSDLGSFDALYEELPKDENSNSSLVLSDSKKEHKANDQLPITNHATGNLIISEKQVAVVDVDDLIIIDTADALLISKKGSSQKVKEVVKTLKERNSELPNIHVTAHRPWGTYTILDESNGYKVKRIVVKPGKRLSLQKHYHRSEHWVVVSGTAIVTQGTETYAVRANESTYIPIGEIHRLENVGKIPLVMIEAQVGEYVGEDDIVRMEDDFKRA
ncbi:mannose-1-phosphate guanylyltransferase/mannose-6-phosphate isomerase [Sulfurovum sp. ST-21]|uniref:mannose-1-phosphate guanylyltransferase n=1 Tax=Sulfurovum indicum TaxID=2779528 RepID=A0A7M1S6J5_9BACT|nr:mannose-1-phosphate guanylyltransferase/mannose-6-phosphate isomerase [Sulfurovum indicum]QOR62601.1 mannose-1-phosphate guanylyltransferase/mannose-6-phosphate isomerase [Sulfurovum indicum]